MKDNGWVFNPKYADIDTIRNKARKRLPRFAWEYLSGGCNEDVNLHKNTRELRSIELKPYYLRNFCGNSLRTVLWNKSFDAPFGVAPIGLQGLIWPGSAEILAKASLQHNIPFILSTVTTASIESISKLTEGTAWFQLYHPVKDSITDDILNRLESNGYDVLVLLCDVPSFGFRPRDIRNGLSMPPRMNPDNILQAFLHPAWSMKTLRAGIPSFANLTPYMEKNMNMSQLGKFMNRTFEGRLNPLKVARLRDKWKGKLVLKGVATAEDAEAAIHLGIDGLIVSNHGGRQLDAAQSSIMSLRDIKPIVAGKIPLMMDSGIQTGPDIARAIAAGADFVFLGRTFMYSVAALGNDGGNHIMSLLKVQLRQILDQLCCSQPSQLLHHAVQNANFQQVE